MVEAFELIGYRKVYIVENDYSNYTWVEIAVKEFNNLPTEEEKEQFCKDYHLDKIVLRQVELCVFR